MCYAQAMKHSRNHRKDRFYQQCSGGIYSAKEWTFAIVDSETKEILSNGYKTKNEAQQAQLHYADKYTQIVDVCNGRAIIY